MDRTMIAPYKAEEKELSTTLYKKLKCLNLLYAPTDEFRKCVSEDMFLKPNPQAFIHVMHYLFRLLDPAEFKKRFYWPITDKKTEANFRTSTVDYLKYLNEKHQLNWTNIKSYLVVMPGGMRFINFLLDFVGFVIKELTRQREKQMSSYLTPTDNSNLNLQTMRLQNEYLKDYASAFIQQADANIAKKLNKIQLIKQQLHIMSQKTGLTVKQLTDDAFLAQFDASNWKLYEQNIAAPAAKIEPLEQPLNDLKQVMENFQIKEAAEAVKHDEKDKRHALELIREEFSEQMLDAYDDEMHFSAEAYASSRNDIKMNELIFAFNCIHTNVENALDTACEKPGGDEFVARELNSLKTELNHIEMQITDFHKKFSMTSKKPTNLSMTPIHCEFDEAANHHKSALMMKYVSTPPIKLELLESGRNANMRLPLLDDLNTTTMESFNNLLVSRSAHKPSKLANETNFDANTTINKSRIIDPMQLLRTINKSTTKIAKATPTPQRDLDKITVQWKERRCLFGKENVALSEDATPTPLKALNINISGKIEFEYSTESIDSTGISRSQLQDASGSNAILYAKKLSALKKVQDASLNLQNLSTSPSGRLDALVAFESMTQNVPKLQLNDETINEENPTMLNNITAAAVVQKCLQNFNDKPQSLENYEFENDVNAASANANVQPKFSLNISEEDSIFNISDSVLKDVSI